MRFFFTGALALALWGHSPALLAVTYNITTAANFSSLPATLAAGDEIVIQNGTYANVGRTLTAAGTAQNPVRMRAATPGGAVFSGGTQFVLRGSQMVISGLAFDGNIAAGAPKYASGIFRFDTNSSDCILRDCLFRNFDTGSDPTGVFWLQMNGYRHTVEYCSFIGKNSEDPVINIIPTEDEGLSNFPTKDVPRRHLIRHCYFADRTNIGLNGYETIRVGESQYQMYDLSTIVEYCVFERAIYGDDVSNYEPEIISSKSRNNIYRFNTFVQNKGGLVLRHGDDCVVDGNFFFGESGSTMGSGIRIIGLRHIVRNNYLENIDGTGLRAAVCLMKGSGEFPDTSTSNGYESPGTARIFHNTLVNCAQPFALGVITSSSGTTAPKNVEIRNNVVQSAASDGAVIDFNSDNGWTISQITFSGNQAFHASGSYGTLPASGFATGTAVNLGAGLALGYLTPNAGSPLINAAAATVPATLHDVRSRLRLGPPHDAGCFDTEGTGTSFNRPLVKADIGPVFDGRLNANRAPTLLAQPGSQSVFEGAPVSLSVTVESALAVTYQWTKNEVALSGATASTFALGAATLADAGSYAVAVTNTAGRVISFAAALSVAPAAPQITTQPVSQTTGAGGAVTFSVGVNGIAPFSYQWRKNGDPIPTAMSATLMLTNLQTWDAGGYSVVVTNAHGFATSQTATLTVVNGTILLNDTFTDGDRTNQALPDSAKWYASSSTLSVSAGALSVAAGRHALAFFKNTGVQTIAVGEKLTSSFTLNFSTVGNASGGFRLGLFNSNGTARPADPSNIDFLNYDGYILTTTALYPDSSANASGPLVFRQRNPGAGTSLLSTTGSGIYSDVASSPSTAQGFSAGINYTVTVTVTRFVADKVNLSVAVTGGALTNYRFTTNDLSGLVTGFDSFAVLSNSTNGSNFSIDNVSIVHALVPPLDLWRQSNFGTVENSGTAANSADADFDGLPNLLEYFLGRNPLAAETTAPAMPATAEVAGQRYLTLTFTRNLNATGGTLTVRAGPNLTSWAAINPDGPNQLSSSITGSLQTLTIRDNTPMSGAVSRFMQLMATGP